MRLAVAPAASERGSIMLNTHAAKCVVTLVCVTATAPCVLPGCQSTQEQTAPSSHENAIRHIFALDAQRGRERNEDPRRMTVSRASLRYAQSLEEIDYSKAPSDFRDAFLAHAAAWGNFGKTLKGYPHLDTHRLEMHDAIDRIKASDAVAAAAIQQALDEVWSTWSTVEETAKQYGVTTAE